MSDWKKAKVLEVNGGTIRLEILNLPLPTEDDEEYGGERDLNAFFRNVASEPGEENVFDVEFAEMNDVRIIFPRP